MGVRKNSGGRKASRVDPETHGIGGEEGGRKAYGVEETPGWAPNGVGRGVKSSQVDSTRHGEGGGFKLS